MFTRRLDPEGGTLRLTPGEESLFVDMVPSLRSVAMGKKATGASLAPEDELDGGLEEVSCFITLWAFFRDRAIVLRVRWHFVCCKRKALEVNNIYNTSETRSSDTCALAIFNVTYTTRYKTAMQHIMSDHGLMMHVFQVMGPSPDDMDEDEDGMKESAVNRQTALLSLDVLARVLGRRHQGAFIGVLDDVTEIVAGKGPAALPGELTFQLISFFCRPCMLKSPQEMFFVACVCACEITGPDRRWTHMVA